MQIIKVSNYKSAIQEYYIFLDYMFVVFLELDNF